MDNKKIKLTAWGTGKPVFIKQDDIVGIQEQKMAIPMTMVFTNTGKYEVSETMKEILALLPSDKEWEETVLVEN